MIGPDSVCSESAEGRGAGSFGDIPPPSADGRRSPALPAARDRAWRWSRHCPRPDTVL
jgi:hypothetical protein